MKRSKWILLVKGGWILGILVLIAGGAGVTYFVSKPLFSDLPKQKVMNLRVSPNVNVIWSDNRSIRYKPGRMVSVSEILQRAVRAGGTLTVKKISFPRGAAFSFDTGDSVIVAAEIPTWPPGITAGLVQLDGHTVVFHPQRQIFSIVCILCFGASLIAWGVLGIIFTPKAMKNITIIIRKVIKS